MMNDTFGFKKSFKIVQDKETKNNMVRKRITITIHDIELSKLKQIALENKETISGMITRLIQQYKQ